MFKKPASPTPGRGRFAQAAGGVSIRLRLDNWPHFVFLIRGKPFMHEFYVLSSAALDVFHASLWKAEGPPNDVFGMQAESKASVERLIVPT